MDTQSTTNKSLELDYIRLKEFVKNKINEQKNNKAKHYLSDYINQIKAMQNAKISYKDIATFLNKELNLKDKRLLTGKKLSQFMFKLKGSVDQNEVNNILNNIKKDIEMDIRNEVEREVEKEVEKNENWENI